MPKQVKKAIKLEQAPVKEIEIKIPPSIVQETPITSTILQYMMIMVIVGLIWATFNLSMHIHVPPLNGPAALFFSLACAFTWVNVLKWGVTKPFNCIKCMSGWIALSFALIFHVDHWYLYLPAGLFVGALFEGIKMKFL